MFGEFDGIIGSAKAVYLVEASVAMMFILLVILSTAWVACGLAYCCTGNRRWLLGPALLTFLCLMRRSSHDSRQRVLTELSTSELDALRSEIVRLQARTVEQSQ